MARQDAQLARNVVLALVVHTPRHGWAIHEQLSPTGDIGHAWTLSRQLVYRAIDKMALSSGLYRKMVAAVTK
jgi:DNA-binding PadR family transcriptional regulator